MSWIIRLRRGWRELNLGLPVSYSLGVDLGMTFTAAAVTEGDRAPTIVDLGDHSAQIPSVLHLRPDGSCVVGEAAVRRGVEEPTGLVRDVKRRIGDEVPLHVGGRPYTAQALTARLLQKVVAAVSQRMGTGPDRITLTHPANWGPYKLRILEEVADLARLEAVNLRTEPEAAAAQYATHTALAAGDRLAIYDLGGGTFDVCVLETTDTGFELLGSPEGLEHLGGVDFDQAVFEHVWETSGAARSGIDIEDPTVTASLARLRHDCVDLKEALSTDVYASVAVNLPGFYSIVRMTRPEFENFVREPLHETIAATARALESAHIGPDELRSVVLVGGSSRIPLVGELLHQEFRVPTALDLHPKYDVALGASRLAAQHQTAQHRPTPILVPSPSGPPPETQPPPDHRPTSNPAPPADTPQQSPADDTRKLRLGLAIATGLVIVAIAITVAAMLDRPSSHPPSTSTPQPKGPRPLQRRLLSRLTVAATSGRAAWS